MLFHVIVCTLMRGIILVVDNYDYYEYEGEMAKLAMNEGFSDFAFAYTQDIDRALEIFFDQTPALIIANSRLPNGRETLESLKSEEMYRHIPIMVVTPEYNHQVYLCLYGAGADAVITYKEVQEGHLPLRAKPLLTASALFQLKILRSNELQENNLLDFILIDLVKPYVARNIWKIAQENARQQKIEIRAVESQLAIAFGDLKSFTTRSQSMSPIGVIEFLNVAFEVVTRHIYAHNGDIDKFIGDAFFAVFDNARDAVIAMAAIQRELLQVRDQRLMLGDNFVQFRIGVNYGSVIRGNVGGNGRYDNTLIGDTINTCSRLEHEAPVGGILVSYEAAINAKMNIDQNDMQAFELRGRSGPTYAFSYFDLIESGKFDEQKWMENNEQN